jgi:hypothetical protein
LPVVASKTAPPNVMLKGARNMLAKGDKKLPFKELRLEE